MYVLSVMYVIITFLMACGLASRRYLTVYIHVEWVVKLPVHKL